MGWAEGFYSEDGVLQAGMSSCRTKRGMCKSGGINLTGNRFGSDKVSVSFVVRSDRDLAFVTISLPKKTIRGGGK